MDRGLCGVGFQDLGFAVVVVKGTPNVSAYKEILDNVMLPTLQYSYNLLFGNYSSRFQPATDHHIPESSRKHS